MNGTSYVSLEDSMTNDSYFNISEIQLSITSLFSVKIMSYLGASDITYSDLIDFRDIEVRILGHCVLD